MEAKRALVSAILAGALLSVFASAPAAAHGGTTGEHSHLLPVVVFLGSVVVLGGSLAADHWGLLDRSTADVGVLAGGLGVVLSIGLLWL